MPAPKHIVLGITGGIAAYKIPLLLRELVKGGAEVRVVMTESASAFVAPAALSALSGHDVVIGMFPSRTRGIVGTDTWHIELAQWADIMLIAPATANTLAKLAHGFADNAVTTLALALRCPLVLSPAMDTDMWNHPLTQSNVSLLREQGCAILPPEEGPLASGLSGPGRLPEIASILKSLNSVISHARQDFRGRKILVTAGPTREAIDAVRFIGNRSSGRMGFAVATAAAHRGAQVTLVTGPVSLPTPRNVTRVDVESAAEMYSAVTTRAKSADVIIMAAAVADFTPVRPVSGKMKKSESNGGRVTLELKQTADILHTLGQNRGRRVLVGFALETDNGIANATEKLRRKNCDWIVLNNPREAGSGFETDTNSVTLISRDGTEERLPLMPKLSVAHAILDRVSRRFRKGSAR